MVGIHAGGGGEIGGGGETGGGGGEIGGGGDVPPVPVTVRSLKVALASLQLLPEPPWPMEHVAVNGFVVALHTNSAAVPMNLLTPFTQLQPVGGGMLSVSIPKSHLVRNSAPFAMDEMRVPDVLKYPLVDALNRGSMPMQLGGGGGEIGGGGEEAAQCTPKYALFVVGSLTLKLNTPCTQ